MYSVPPFTSASVQINLGAAGPATIVGPGTVDPRAPTIVLPRVGQSTAKLNDEGGGALVTTLRQTDTVSNADVDPLDGLPHIRFAFAPVLDDPNHSPEQQPYFYVVVKNLADNSVLFEQFAFALVVEGRGDGGGHGRCTRGGGGRGLAGRHRKILISKKCEKQSDHVGVGEQPALAVVAATRAVQVAF